MLKTSKQFFVSSAVFAMTAFPIGSASAQSTIDFTVSADKVIPSEEFALKVSVLGAAIEQNGTPFPVTLSIRIGEETYQPFGPLNNPQTGNVNNNKPARHFTLQEIFDRNAPITVTGVAWQPGSGRIYKQRTTQELSSYVHVLRNGDPVPVMPGYENQSAAAEFVRDYIDADTQTIALHRNQVIYLFELGTDDLGAAAADFQDLVVLVTLGKSPEELANAELMDAMYD